MAKVGQAVQYNDGNRDDILALVEKVNDDGTVHLVTFPGASVEHEANVPKGEGGRTFKPLG